MAATIVTPRYAREIDEIAPGAFAFDLRLIRPGAQSLALLPALESVTWDDAAEQSATLTLRRPAGVHRPDSLPIAEGHTCLLRYRWDGAWRGVWQLRCGRPQPDLDAGTVQVELADGFWPLRGDEREWTFRKTKKRGRGWWPGEATRFVLRELGVQAGTIPRGRHRINSLELKGNGIDAIRRIWAHERERTGDRFRIRLTDRVHVLPFHRPGTLLVVAAHVTGVQVAEERKDRPATVLTAVGRVGKGKGARTARVTVTRPGLAERLGRRTAKRNVGRVDSAAELRAKAHRELADELEVKRTASFSFPGVPWIGRGSGLRWITTEPGFHGSTRELRDRSVVWVQSAEHTLTGDSYTTSVEVDQVDPWIAERERRDRARRQAERDRRTRKGHS